MSLYNDDFQRSLRLTLDALDNAGPITMLNPIPHRRTVWEEPEPPEPATVWHPYKWRPIEDAPKDGTRMIGMNGADISIITWQHGQWRLALPGQPATETPWTPTHFLPLTALPSEVES